MSDESKSGAGGAAKELKEAAEAIDALAKTLHADEATEELAQPLGRVVGTTLELILIPLLLLRHGARKAANWLAPQLELRLKDVPKEKVRRVDPMIGAPAVEGLLLAFEHDELRTAFANLLAAAANTDTANNVLPSFPAILRQLSPDEARILRWVHDTGRPIPVVHMYHRFRGGIMRQNELVATNLSPIAQQAGLTNPRMVPAYIDSLARHELFTDIDADELGELEEFKGVSHLTEFRQAQEEIEGKGGIAESSFRLLQLSDLGRAFCEVCMGPHSREMKT